MTPSLVAAQAVPWYALPIMTRWDGPTSWSGASSRCALSGDDEADSEELYLEDFSATMQRSGAKKARPHYDFVDNELNPLLVDVEGSEVKFLAVDQMIDSFRSAREVVFDIPEGLFNLNG